MQDKTVADLENELSELFGAVVAAEPISKESRDGVSITVCNVSVTRRRNDVQSHRVRQTTVVLDADDLDLPEFALSPSAQGIAGMIFARLGGFGDINFPDSPEFSKKYHLHGWVEEPVRILFTQAIRKHFSIESDWSVRGKGTRIVIFHSNKIVNPDRLEDFIGDCLPILELFQAGERALDERPELRRQTEASDVVETAGRMGGLVGNRLQSQIRNISVSRQELRAFEADSPPRSIPATIKRQVMGSNLPLVFVGLIIIVAGLVVGIGVFTTIQGPFRWMGVSMMVMMPLAGALLSVLTILYRRKKARVLRSGKLTNGQIANIERTGNSINSQMEHRVSIRYSIGDAETTATCPVYGVMADQARTLEKSGQQVNVLVDPNNPGHIVCTDFLLVLDE